MNPAIYRRALADRAKGVIHRTRAPERAVILMVETASIVPTGDG